MRKEIRMAVYDEELQIEAYRLRELCSLFRAIFMNIM